MLFEKKGITNFTGTIHYCNSEKTSTFVTVETAKNINHSNCLLFYVTSFFCSYKSITNVS